MIRPRVGIDPVRVRSSERVAHVQIGEGGGQQHAHNVDRGSAFSPARIHIYYLLSASVVLFAAGCQAGGVEVGFSPPAV